ncbi:hypothetical protein D3C86_2219200 [compost metagenome]
MLEVAGQQLAGDVLLPRLFHSASLMMVYGPSNHRLGIGLFRPSPIFQRAGTARAEIHSWSDAHLAD